METEHTPGPWKVRFGDKVDGDGVRVVDCDTGPMPPDEAKANARLIAAAPQLLAELDAARATIADTLDNMPYMRNPRLTPGPDMSPEQQAWRTKLTAASRAARAAIAQAKGEGDAV